MHCLDYSRDHRKTILIVGSGRSGTTWLANVVNYKNEYRDVFEPFHPVRVPIAHNLRYNVYLRPDDPHPEFQALARPLLTGAFQNDWTNRNNRRRIADKRIVKEIRLHHSLKWIAAHFPQMPIVLVLRHPLAVAESRRALNWPSRIEIFLERPELVADYLEPFVPHIQRALPFPEQSFERDIFFWCIENYVPLQQFRPGEIHLAYYEDLVLDPAFAIRLLFQFLNKPFEPRVLEVIETPSSQTRSDSSVHSRTSKLDRWERAFTPAQIAFALDTLRLFGLDRLYTDALTPHHPA
ncbi:MAG: sulfotransferase [Anaerolineae bacterium]|nr:sulfotransferase [Anaerolineae bacterium]